MLKGAMDMAIRAANDNRAMYTACVLIFVAFAVAHMVAIMFPAKDGQPQQTTRVVTGVCIIGVLLFAIWFLYAAHDAASLLSD